MEFHRRRKVDTGIDMTPMIDTLLQLFVVFMLNMSFLASAVRLDLPKASGRQPAPTRAIVVSIDATNRVLIDNKPVARDGLRERLIALLQEGRGREVVLRADRTLPYGDVLEALIAIRQAGVNQMHLAYEEAGRGP
ncbi:MAG TPA: biopolymer transporter ExbD [Isosphaeraceae bacterium]|nr:biopolymer transporter ExbD [Isosphaeraceae bacterium]